MRRKELGKTGVMVVATGLGLRSPPALRRRLNLVLPRPTTVKSRLIAAKFLLPTEFVYNDMIAVHRNSKINQRSKLMNPFIKRSKLISCAVAVAGCSLKLGAATISTFNFDGAAGSEASYAPSTQTAGVTVGSISRGSGLTSSANSGTFSASGWTTAASRDANDYFDFSISVETGFVLDLDRLELDERRSATGIRAWSIYSSLDGFSTALATFGVPDNASTRTDQGVDLGSAFDALTGVLSFRIYGYGSESGSGTWRVDNVDLFGAISKVSVTNPIATPDGGGSLLLLSVALGGLAGVCRRKSERS